MAQYIRGRIGMDRSMVLDMDRIPGYHARRWPPSALSQGQRNERPRFATLLARHRAGMTSEPMLERAPKRSKRELQHGDRQRAIQPNDGV
jgi:hypothetical protein